MANPSVTYTFTNSTTADGTQVSQNFSDLIAGMTDGTKSFSIDALTVAGAALFNGAMTLGKAAGDDITVTGSIASSIPLKTDSAFDIGTSSVSLRVCYTDKIQGGSTAGCEIVGRTDGVAPSIGMVGETLTVSAVDTATNTSGATAIASLTLTTGWWLVSASSESRAAATQTGAIHYLEIKGVGGTTKGKDLINVTGQPAGAAHMITYANHIVNIASGDANKNIRTTQQSVTAAGLGCSYITAVRIA